MPKGRGEDRRMREAVATKIEEVPEERQRSGRRRSQNRREIAESRRIQIEISQVGEKRRVGRRYWKRRRRNREGGKACEGQVSVKWNVFIVTDAADK